MYQWGILIGFIVVLFGSRLLIAAIKFTEITWTGKKNILISVTIIIFGVLILAGISGYKAAILAHHIQ